MTQLVDLMSSVTQLSPRTLVLAGAALSGIILLLQRLAGKRNQPPTLSDRIPYLSNTYQYLTNVEKFMNRVSDALKASESNIIKFNIGFKNAYIVTGTRNVQQVFGSPSLVDGNFLQLILMDKHWSMSKEEIARFANDKSGRLKTPLPGSESVLDAHRYWRGHDELYAEYLTKRKNSDSLAEAFVHRFSERLDESCSTEWRETRLIDLLKRTMAEAAIVTLFGTKILELNAGFVDQYWEFDEVAGNLVWGLPKWMTPNSVKTHEKLIKMTRRHIDSAWEHFDWNGPDKDAEWEPHFGSRLSRETAKWLRNGNFSDQAAAGHTLASLFGLNGNTVPITTWFMIELVKDRTLLDRVRRECASAVNLDEKTGKRRFDAQKLINLPLMQSIYIEIMRIHVSFNPTREVLQPLSIDGYVIPKGSLLQASSQLAHFEDAVWGVESHPAAEFYADRHIKCTESKDESGEPVVQKQFSMKGRPSSFFPYGGGYVMCPGRHFAKQEILLAVAVLVTEYELEFAKWEQLDGSESDREALDDKRFAGFIAMSPDREMVLRWRKTSA